MLIPPRRKLSRYNFRPTSEITGPTAALIRFRKDGNVPAHTHAGYEHIIVLAGTQRDQNGTAAAGTLIINPPGTQHSVTSEAGCIVLAIYERPVKFLPLERADG